MNRPMTTCSMINLPHTTHRPINFSQPLISFPLVPSQFHFASLSCPCSFYLLPWIQFNHLSLKKKKKKNLIISLKAKIFLFPFFFLHSKNLSVPFFFFLGYKHFSIRPIIHSKGIYLH